VKHFVIPREPLPGSPRLRRTQMDVLVRIAAGMSCGEIAREYRIRECSVSASCQRMRRHFAARNNVDLIAQALLSGVLQPAAIAVMRANRPPRRKSKTTTTKEGE
jgi:DNA-binding CsgD family transcriptional regulator